MEFVDHLDQKVYGRRKVEYTAIQIPIAVLEDRLNDFGLLINICSPQTLRSMHSLLRSRSYYRRPIEDFAIYESLLYELREADFHEIPA